MDPTANLITMLKNAGGARKEIVTVPFSNMNLAIIETLEKAGFIKSFSKKSRKAEKVIEIELSYEEGKPKIKGVERVSKLSRRMYRKAKDIRPFLHGYGATILSTPKGVLVDKEAKKANVGGEILFRIW
jgi:small subunit ribosomal protein S8